MPSTITPGIVRSQEILRANPEFQPREVISQLRKEGFKQKESTLVTYFHHARRLNKDRVKDNKPPVAPPKSNGIPTSSLQAVTAPPDVPEVGGVQIGEAMQVTIPIMLEIGTLAEEIGFKAMRDIVEYVDKVGTKNVLGILDLIDKLREPALSSVEALKATEK